MLPGITLEVEDWSIYTAPNAEYQTKRIKTNDNDKT